jgi:hypothetical protein
VARLRPFCSVPLSGQQCLGPGVCTGATRRARGAVRAHTVTPKVSSGSEPVAPLSPGPDGKLSTQWH